MSTVLTESFDGVPGGMNLALPAQELDDTEARYLQDILVDYPGLARRRGPVRKVTGIASLSRMGSGIVMALNPLGQERYAVLNGDGSNGYFSILSDDLTSIATELAWPHPFPTTQPAPYRIVDAKPALNGGLMIGVSSAYDSNAPNQGIAYWLGANKPNYSAGSITVARGSASVTAPSGFNANVAVGHWLFATTDNGYTNVLVGYVKQVNSDTSLTLGAVSPYNITTNAATFQALRGLAPKVVTGRITVDTTSKTATGGATKFISQGLSDALSRSGTTHTSTTIDGLSATSDLMVGMSVSGSGIPANATIATIASSSSITISAAATASATVTLSFGSLWNIYRASDMSFVGKVASVQSEFALTFAANAAIAMASEAYIALRADSDYSIANTASTKKVGFLNGTYAGRQWYANNGGSQEKLVRIWFSDESDPEALDLSVFDGDWDDIPNTAGVNESIRSILATALGLIVFKENETWIVGGSSPNTFSPKKLEDDGTLCGMSAQPWAGGVIWAGREGIHLFDGVNTTNLVESKLGEYWKQTIATFNPSQYRMWSYIAHDHYHLFIENVSPTVSVVKGNVSSAPTRLTVVINLITRAITLHTNLNIRGAVTLPASAGKSVRYLVNGQVSGDSSDHAFICDADALFTEEGVDPITCDGGTPGPDYFFESKKYDAGDPTRLKKFKLLILEYLVQGGYIKVDVALGLNNIAKTLTGNFPQSVMSWDTLRANVSTWDGVKAQYATWNDLIQGVFMPKRVKFQKGSQFLSFRLYQSNSGITRLQTGPFGIGYKLQRPGRV